MLRDCGTCACATKVWNGASDELLCANYPGHEGDLSRVTSGAASMECRRFKLKRRGAADAPPVVLDENVRYLSLGDGKSVLVDAADFEWLSRYKWRTTGGTKGYVHTRIKGKSVYIHRLIMNPPPGKVVDHINGNVWDNRRRNLRVCTRAQNSRNSVGRSGTSSLFKGVTWDRRARKWVAIIVHGGKGLRLGSFDDEVEAARAYDRKARELFGAYAYLNFPDEVRYVCLRGRICVHSHATGRMRVRKSEIRNKFEAPKFEIQNKCKVRAGASIIGSFGLWGLSRISKFMLRISRWRVVHSPVRPFARSEVESGVFVGAKKNRADAPQRAGGSAGNQKELVAKGGVNAGPSAVLFACVGVPARRVSRSKRSASCRGSDLLFHRAF